MAEPCRPLLPCLQELKSLVRLDGLGLGQAVPPAMVACMIAAFALAGVPECLVRQFCKAPRHGGIGSKMTDEAVSRARQALRAYGFTRLEVREQLHCDLCTDATCSVCHPARTNPWQSSFVHPVVKTLSSAALAVLGSWLG
jgi:hypothetical protein